MALLTTQDASAGLASVATVAASGGGDTVTPGARSGGWGTGVFLVVRNTDAASKDVTVRGVVYTVPATTGLAIIPISGVYPNNPVPVTYSAVTNLAVGVVQIEGK